MRLTFLTVISLLTISLFLTSYDNNHKEEQESVKLEAWYAQTLEQTRDNLKEMIQLIEKADDFELTTAYQETRKSFKSSEFLFFYLSRHEAETFVNGAPLPKLSKDSDTPYLIDPKGFQVVDEWMADLSAEDARSELKNELSFLLARYNKYTSYSSQGLLYNREIFEAMRHGIWQISTLSISGFDTPGTSMALVDAYHSLKGIQWCFELFESKLNEKQFDKFNETLLLFEKGKENLQMGEFESFDRFGFTRDYIIPLSENLLEAQIALNIEFRDEVEALPTAVNFRKAHLFEEGFLNDGFFRQTAGFKVTSEVVDLGQKLFFDPILSLNNKRACASCHSPDKAFSEDKPKSLAFNEEDELDRNAMTLTNSVYSEKFFYDLRADQLFLQFEHVFMNQGEFNTTYPQVVEKLNNCSDYRKMFDDAFSLNGKTLKKQHLNVALGSYVSSLTSQNSDFDKMIRSEVETDQQVATGYNLFMGKAMCGTCHFPPTFAGLRPPYFDESEAEVIGVPVSEDFDNPELDPDLGKMASGRPFDEFENYRHSFKTVSTRNIALSAPYFHNGAITSLEKVVEFYNLGGGVGLGFDLPNQTLPFDSLSLSEDEQKQIITFLHALTDIEGMTDTPENLPNCSSELSERTVGGNY